MVRASFIQYTCVKKEMIVQKNFKPSPRDFSIMTLIVVYILEHKKSVLSNSFAKITKRLPRNLLGIELQGRHDEATYHNGFFYSYPPLLSKGTWCIRIRCFSRNYFTTMWINSILDNCLAKLKTRK